MSNVGEAPIPRKRRGCLRDAAIVGSVILVLLLVVGAAASFVFFLADNSLRQEDMASLTENEVYADLAGLDIPLPDLSEYAYLTSNVLSGPHFDNIEIGNIRYGSMKDGHMTSSTRIVNADVVWKNAVLEVIRPLTAEFEFTSAEEGWRLTIHTLGEMRATPLRPLNVYELEDDIPALLRMYDPVLGETYADAHVQLEDNLWNTGGTVKATLSKTVDGTPMECTMNLVVSWSETHGWIVDVASVNAQSSGTIVPSAEADVDAISPEPVEGESKSQALYCHQGDLVALVGTLTQEDGIFVLETRPTAVHMSGRTWNVEQFVVTGSSAGLTENLGRVLTVKGYVTVGYVLEDAPLSLAMVSAS